MIFAHWREALNQAALSPAARAGYAFAIDAYLEYCRRNGLGVTLERARAFMADAQRRQLARNPQLWKTHVRAKPGLGVRSPLDG